MENDLDPDIIKATQSSLGKYVKRPPLTEKLLKKPPFRFLHDIFTTVQKTTGFFEGLFEEQELVSENVKDRDSKILYLNKIISVLAIATGKTISAKASKIVAGQEPDKTNELLQCLAYALDNKLSSSDAVKKYKEQSKGPQKSDKQSSREKGATKVVAKNTSSKLASKSSEKLVSQKKTVRENSINRNEKDKKSETKITTKKSKENLSQKKESPPKKNQKDNKIQENDKKIELLIQDEKKIKPIAKENIPVELKVDESTSLNTNYYIESKDTISNDLNSDKSDTDQNPFVTGEVDLNSSLSSQGIVENELLLKQPSENLNSIEMSHDVLHENTDLSDNKSIEREVPLLDNTTVGKIKNTDNERIEKQKSLEIVQESKFDNNRTRSLDKEPSISDQTNTKPQQNYIIRPASVRPSSSRPGAPRLRDKLDNLTTETDNILVGKVNIISENAPNEEDEEANSIVVVNEQIMDPIQPGDEEQLMNQQHGHLVQQILNSQKEFSQISGKAEIDWQFGVQKARETVNQEIEQLSYNIQALSRVANPLGKLLDHIQEDVEVMRQELQQWATTYQQTSVELTKQKALNTDALQPLHAKLKQLNIDVEEKHEKIQDLKIVVHKNSSRIEKLLTSGNVQ